MFNVVKKGLLNFISNRFGIPHTAIAYIKPMTIAGRQTKIGLPKDLISLNVLNLVRGIFNNIVIPSYLNWVWPYWVVRQHDSKGLSFIPRGFQIPSINVAHRNWTAIGNLMKEKEAILDTRGMVTPNIDGWSIDIFAVYKGVLYAPPRLRQIKQRVLHSIPVIETTFEVENFVLLITTFAQNIYDRDVILHQVEVSNHGLLGDDISVYVSIRPYNPEGISLIHKILYQNEEFYVNGSLGLLLMEKPHHVLCSNFKQGDVSLQIVKKPINSKYDSKCDAGLATACAGYDIYLNPGEQKELEFRIPMDKKIIIKKELYREGSYDKYKQDTVNEWKKKLQDSIQISIPDKKLEKAFKTNISYLMLFYDGKSITPGPFSYHHFWFRDAAYLLQALAKAGFINETREVLHTYPSRQKLNGVFHSQLSEWDSNGQAIWTIAEYYRLTKDKETLRKLLPSVHSGARWLIDKLNKTANKDIPYQGLMPDGLSAEHFGANDCYYWDDYWALKGLIDAKFLIEQLPDEKIDTRRIGKAIERLQKNINDSLLYANKKFDKPCLPISPTRYMDSAAIGSLATIYPLKIFDPTDERLVNTMEFLEQNCFTNGVFFHDINHSGHGTYLNMHVAQVYLAQRNPKALDILQWMLNIATHTFTWPESIHPFTFGGVIGDGHHGWAAADFLMVVRNMLFVEENDVLVLTPVIPKDWVSLFEIIEVKNALSYFGNINFKYEVVKNHELTILIENVYDVPPKNIEINLPVKIVSVEINDTVLEINANKFLVSPTTAFIKVTFEQ
ncbi:MAG: hypothetical protein PHV30_07155 [Candidatus Margulisbacteria bacterium]|nr:hypothetical protein [Candidatus Margulisiibacteriota bacterium]